MTEVADKAILELCNGNSKEYQKLKAQRIQANKLLLEQLSVMVNQFPDLRFSQILANFGFVKTVRDFEHNGNSLNPSWADEYHLEPTELLKRVIKSIKEVYNG